MMTVKEYALDINKDVKVVLEKCRELGFNAKNEDERRLGKALGTIRLKLKQYEGKIQTFTKLCCERADSGDGSIMLWLGMVCDVCSAT